MYHASDLHLGYQIPAHTGLLISHPDPSVNIRLVIINDGIWSLVEIWQSKCDTLAEWLRRLTRNQLELFRVGSSPASVDFCSSLLFSFTQTVSSLIYYFNYIELRHLWEFHLESIRKRKGPTEIRTQVRGIRILGDNQLHYRTNSCLPGKPTETVL